MTICEGKRTYLLMSDTWLKVGRKYQVIDDENELAKYGVTEMAGKQCVVRAIEQCTDTSLYDGKVGRIRCDGEHENDYMYWLPPSCLIPIFEEPVETEAA